LVDTRRSPVWWHWWHLWVGGMCRDGLGVFFVLNEKQSSKFVTENFLSALQSTRAAGGSEDSLMKVMTHSYGIGFYCHGKAGQEVNVVKLVILEYSLPCTRSIPTTEAALAIGQDARIHRHVAPGQLYRRSWGKVCRTVSQHLRLSLRCILSLVLHHTCTV
jgi:hypothetical protein